MKIKIYRPKIESYSEKVDRMYPPSAKEKRTRQVTFKVTDDCNLRCTYCYQTNKKKNSMSLEIGKKMIHYMFSAYDAGISYFKDANGIILDFIGGEPLLEIELIDQLVDYYFSIAITQKHPWMERTMIHICTNGILYFEKKVQQFLKKHQHHLSLSITLDGNQELHDKCRIFPDGSPSYDKVIKAVQTEMKRSSIWNLGTKITISPDNLSYLYEAIIHMVNLGFAVIHANVVFEEGWEYSHASLFYVQLKKIADYFLENNLTESVYCSLFEPDYFEPMEEEDNQNWCGGTGKMLACDTKGNFYPCIRYMETSLGSSVPELKIGDLKHGLGGTQDCASCIEKLEKITRRSQSTDHCYYCPIAKGCAWCSGYNYQVFGTPNKRATYICVMHKARALANAYFWNCYVKQKGITERFLIHLSKEEALKIISEIEYQLLKKLERCE